MKLGTQVVLGSGHSVLDGDPDPPSRRGTAPPQFSADVYCGQTAGWIKMALGMEVGLGPGHIVLDQDSASLPKKGAHTPPIFGPFLLWPNGWMPQDTTWYEGKPRPRPHCARWGPSYPLKRGTHPIVGPCLLWLNGWMDQDATWYDGRPRSGQHCVRCGPSSTPNRHSPQFLAHVCCGQTAGWIMMSLGTKVGLGQDTLCYMGTQPPPPKGAQPPIFGPCLLWPNGCPSQLLLSTCTFLSVTFLRFQRFFYFANALKTCQCIACISFKFNEKHFRKNSNEITLAYFFFRESIEPNSPIDLLITHFQACNDWKIAFHISNCHIRRHDRH